jgi:hypothetical protein
MYAGRVVNEKPFCLTTEAVSDRQTLDGLNGHLGTSDDSGGSRCCVWGDQIERRRRENRGAEGGRGMGGGVHSLGRDCAPRQKNF